MPDQMEDEIRRFFQGLKKREVNERQSGKRSIAVGKQPLEFGLYKWLCTHFWLKGNHFAVAYTSLSWNLMARTKSIEDIKHVHIDWYGDSMRVYFAKQKNDQGKRLDIKCFDRLS